MNPLIRQIISFIRSVGIEVSFSLLDETCFLPGITIQEGKILIDIDRLKYPGDLLHEAGHIAVVPLAERSSLDSDSISQRPERAAEEMMAMAWSYAAGRHIGIDPEIIFHGDGYQGGGSNLLQSFETNSPIGAPMLQYHGMCYFGKHATEAGVEPYPAMLHWTNPAALKV